MDITECLLKSIILPAEHRAARFDLDLACGMRHLHPHLVAQGIAQPDHPAHPLDGLAVWRIPRDRGAIAHVVGGAHHDFAVLGDKVRPFLHAVRYANIRFQGVRRALDGGIA